MFTKKILSERIYALRTAKNIKQEDLGNAVGLKKSAICMIEKGERAVSIEVLCALADYFNVSIDYLVGRNNNPNSHKL